MSVDYHFEIKIDKLAKEDIIKIIDGQELAFFAEDILVFPKIPVCHIAYGWMPYFFKSKYWDSNLESLKEFYNKHRNVLLLKAEYGEIVDFDMMISQIEELSTQGTLKIEPVLDPEDIQGNIRFL